MVKVIFVTLHKKTRSLFFSSQFWSKQKLSLSRLFVCLYFSHIRLWNETDYKLELNKLTIHQWLKNISTLSLPNISLNLLLFLTAYGTELVAFFSQNGLHGEFRFMERADNTIEIRSTLETTLQFPEQVWEWSLHEMPIDYSDVNARRRCHSTKIGAKIVDLTDYLDYIQLPGNESTTWTVPANLLGRCRWIILLNFASYPI